MALTLLPLQRPLRLALASVGGMASPSVKAGSIKPLKSVSIGGKFKFKSKKPKQHLIDPSSGLVSLEVATKVKEVSKGESYAKPRLTESQERQRKVMESREVKKVAEKSYRERIEEFNHALGTQTEHNDIPRVSSAGNG